MSSPGNQIVPIRDPSGGRLRSTWRWYKESHPVVRIAIPFGLGIACIAGAWTVLNEGEYAVALALVSLFLLFGIQAARETAWSRTAKCVVSFVFLVIAIYSSAVILKKAHGKPLSNLLAEKEETARVTQSPPASPSPTPTAKPSPSPFSFYSMFVARGESDALLKMRALDFPYQAVKDKNTVIILCRIDMPVHDGPTLSIYIPKTATMETAVDAALYAVTHQNQIIDKLLAELKADDRNAIALKARPVSVKRIHLYHEQPFNRSLVTRGPLPIHFFGPRFMV